ncbi:hypothetical protein [Rothia halotolerans]|uniref:hypothetical protein n=1 Tax=Rothia halotolerans TaxID=405770 RepID=UPI00101DD880|nr:hypothetical protein [Rothia halotolerans]
MTEYALSDRGSIDLVTEDYYDTEILRLFDGLRFDREQMLDAQATLVPETDNPLFPDSIAVYVKDLKVARFTQEDASRYWRPLTRVVASGYTPVAPVRFWATMRKVNGRVGLESRAILSVSRPDLLFPANSSPVHAALLPQGPSLKVLDEKDHAEYLHSILPPSGEGRVILTLEANHLRLADGQEVDSVDVLHDRRVVGRLSTQMSEQLAPVVRDAFAREKLTAAWGTIRGSAYELSLTVQAVRADDIAEAWHAHLPNSLPQLCPEQDSYEIEPAFAPSHAEQHPENKRQVQRRDPAPAEVQEEPRREPRPPRRRAPLSAQGRAGWILGMAGLVVLLLGLVLIFFRPILGILGLLLGGSLAFTGLYVARLQSGAPVPQLASDEEAGTAFPELDAAPRTERSS